MLAAPDLNKKIRTEVDISNYAIVMIQDLKCEVKKQLLYWSNIRELDRVLNTK